MMLNNIVKFIGISMFALYGQAALANSTIDAKYLGSEWGYKSGTISPGPGGTTNISIGAFKMHNETANHYEFVSANDNTVSTYQDKWGHTKQIESANSAADEFIAWCVDPLHWLKTPVSRYNVGGVSDMLTVFGASRVNDLQNLADHFYGGVDTAVESAAFQVATWTVLYGKDSVGNDGIYDFGKYSGSTFRAWNLDSDVQNLAISYLTNLDNGKVTDHYKITYLFDNSNLKSSDFHDVTQDLVTFIPSPVPLPAAAWLFGSALLGFISLSSRRRV